MVEFSLIKFIFQAIPESCGLVAAAMAVMKLPLNWRKIVVLGIVQALSAVVVRQLPVAFGIHTVILIFLLVLYLRVATKSTLSSAFKGALSSFVILVLAEIFFTQFALTLAKTTVEEMAEKPWLVVVVSLPQVIVLFAVSLLLNWQKTRKAQ